MKEIKDICYSGVDNERQKLDLYLPESDEFSVFVYFHGGGIEKGNKSCPEMAEFLTANNIAVASANYRLYPNAAYPDFVRDAAAAVAWVFKNINEYGKCNKIYVGGTSAGAYLSMMLCFDKRWLGIHKISPMEIAGFVHNAGQPTTHFNVLRERGLDYRRVVVDEAAPVYHIGADGTECPPMLHICATNDITGRHDQLKMVMSTMEHFGYDMSKIELRVVEGRHTRYTNVKLADMVKEFIENN